MEPQDLSSLSVIVPNLHWHYTGVTAANRMAAPRIARRFAAAWLGPDAPKGIGRLTLGDLLRLRSRYRAGKADTRCASVMAKLAGTWQLQSSVCIRSLIRQPFSWRRIRSR